MTVVCLPSSSCDRVILTPLVFILDLRHASSVSSLIHTILLLSNYSVPFDVYARKHPHHFVVLISLACTSVFQTRLPTKNYTSDILRVLKAITHEQCCPRPLSTIVPLNSLLGHPAYPGASVCLLAFQRTGRYVQFLFPLETIHAVLKQPLLNRTKGRFSRSVHQVAARFAV